MSIQPAPLPQELQPFPDASKVWVYLASRPLTPEETTEIVQRLQQFCIAWTAHNNQLKAAGFILWNRLLLLVVDETQNKASGCSIDKSVHLLRQLEKDYALQLFDRLQIPFLESGELKTFPYPEFKSWLESGKLQPTTLVFNNAVDTLGQLRAHWILPLAQSFLQARMPAML